MSRAKPPRERRSKAEKALIDRRATALRARAARILRILEEKKFGRPGPGVEIVDWRTLQG